MRIFKFLCWYLLLASTPAIASLQWNLTRGVTPVSHDIYLLHMTVLWICVAIGVLVFGVIFYSILRFRRSQGIKPEPFHGNLKLELAWTLIPTLILIALAIPSTRVLTAINDTSAPDLTIQITGFQWKWQYNYLNHGIHFFSNISTPYDQIYGNSPKSPLYLREVDKPLILPIHKKVRLLITSNDVIHSWWVPHLGVKKDAVPGFINESWTKIDRPGIYRGQCAELCGINHAYMPIVVQAVTEKEFETWVTQQKNGGILPQVPLKKLSPAETLALGKTTYLNRCSACHQPDGSGSPPAFPNLKISAKVKGPLQQHLETVIHGVPGTAMQAWGQQLTPQEIAAVVTYERQVIGQQANVTVDVEQVITLEGGKPAAQPVTTTQPAKASTSPQNPSLKTRTTSMTHAPSATTKAVTPTGKSMASPQNPQAMPEPNPTVPSASTPAATPASTTDLPTLINQGKTTYMNTCAVCHKPDGTGLPPTFPNLTASPIVKGPVAKHIHTVVFGVPGSAMQAFGQQLTPDELAAVITFERNVLGGKTNEKVLPADIAAVEKSGASAPSPSPSATGTPP